MAAAAIPLALQLIPLIPSMVSAILDVVDAVKSDPAVPDAARRELEIISNDLMDMKIRVAAVELPSPGSGA